MENRRELYLNPNGQDMWLILDPDKKKIKTIDITTRNETTYPFLTKKDAKDNFNCWLNHQELRLPKTFIIKADEFQPRNQLSDALSDLELPIPKRSELKEYVIYHKSKDKYVLMNIENFNNSILPELQAKDLRRIAWDNVVRNQASINKEVVKSGMFSL